MRKRVRQCGALMTEGTQKVPREVDFGHVSLMPLTS